MGCKDSTPSHLFPALCPWACSCPAPDFFIGKMGSGSTTSPRSHRLNEITYIHELPGPGPSMTGEVFVSSIAFETTSKMLCKQYMPDGSLWKE